MNVRYRVTLSCHGPAHLVAMALGGTGPSDDSSARRSCSPPMRAQPTELIVFDAQPGQLRFDPFNQL